MKLFTELNEEMKLLVEEKDGKKNLYLEGICIQTNVKNRNKRIYPKDNVRGEIERYIKEEVNTNRAVGELNHPNCYTDDASVLIKSKGLVKFVDVQVGDITYGVDENGNTVETPVTKVIRQPYSGEVVRIHGRKINARVTPNHRFYLQTRYKGLVVKTAEEIHESLNGHNKLSHEYFPLSMKNYQGDSREFMEIPGIKSTAEYSSKPLLIPMKQFCALMGIYLSEGSLSRDSKTSGENQKYYRVNIHQNLGTNFDLIEDMVRGIDTLNSVSAYKVDDKKGSVIITDMRLAHYLVQFGNCYTKFIPEEIRNSTPENIDEFLEWFVLGDGSVGKSVQKGVTYTKKDVFTVSRKLALHLSECLIKIGHSVNIKTQTSKKDYAFADHVIKVENKSPLFRIDFGRQQGAYATAAFMKAKYEYYEGDVVCLETGTQNFYVMQNEKMHLTGNSPGIDLSKVSHRFVSLTEDGDNYNCKVKILDTPMGQVARGLIEGGVQLGISTRALGSVKANAQGINEVQKDFRLSTAGDLVANPSAPDAFLNSIMEEREWVFKNGIWAEKDIHEMQSIVRKLPSEKAVSTLWEQFLLDIATK